MTVLPIVTHPAEVLEQPCEKVLTFDKSLRKLLDDMYDTMIDADGVGLAAPQIGKAIQVAIVDIDDEHGTVEMINPVIMELSEEEEVEVEGCLSFPGVYGEVQRPILCTIQAQDRKGRHYQLTTSGFMARAIMHEIDHLNGVLFTSKISRYVDEEELGEME